MPRRLPKAILSSQEAETVLAVPDINTAVGLRDRAILETLYSTGIRRTELTRLFIQDVDRDRGTLMIREGKGKKDRMIPIGERALAWIAAYRDRARPELLGDKPDDGALFLNSLGNPLRPFHLTMLTKNYITKSGIGKDGACHLFRHISPDERTGLSFASGSCNWPPNGSGLATSGSMCSCGGRASP